MVIRGADNNFEASLGRPEKRFAGPARAAAKPPCWDKASEVQREVFEGVRRIQRVDMIPRYLLYMVRDDEMNAQIARRSYGEDALLDGHRRAHHTRVP
jgi:hypothetical protein